MLAQLVISGTSVGNTNVWSVSTPPSLMDAWDPSYPIGTTPNSPSNGVDVSALLGLRSVDNLTGSGGGAGNITYASAGSPNGRGAISMVNAASQFVGTWSVGTTIHWLARLKTGAADNSLLQLTGVGQTYAACRTKFYNNGSFVSYSSPISTATWGTLELLISGGTAQVIWEGTTLYSASGSFSSGSTTNYLLFQTPGSMIARSAQYSAALTGNDLTTARLWLASS